MFLLVFTEPMSVLTRLYSESVALVLIRGWFRHNTVLKDCL